MRGVFDYGLRVILPDALGAKHIGAKVTIMSYEQIRGTSFSKV
jgi:hypothetical protein